MGYVKEKYNKAYFLCKDEEGKPTPYGVAGIAEFEKGSIRPVIPSILASLDLKDKVIFSIGFGRGEEIKYALDKGCKQVLGIDFSEVAEKIATEHIKKYYPNTDKVSLLCMDVLDFMRLQGANEPFIDVVFMFDILEHIPRDETIEIFRYLKLHMKPGAIVAVNTPFFREDNDVVVEGLKAGAGDNSDWYPETQDMHCNRYTKSSFMKFMKDVGYEQAGEHQFLFKHKKLNIAIWTYPKWALGQVFNAVTKYSVHNITIFPWHEPYAQDAFDAYDLIHVPIVQAYDSFVSKYPHLKAKVCCSTHGKAELFNYNPATRVRHNITTEEVDEGVLPKEMVERINEIGKMACVSKEIVQMLQSQTKAKVSYTPCGVDLELFSGDIVEHKELTVVCPVTKDYASEHEYDVKRWSIAIILEKILPQIKFVWMDKRVPAEEMADFYRKGDIILCLSHSEGNPLGVMEAGAVGLMPISTMVGEIPELIKHRVNGEIVSRDLVEGMIEILNRLDKCRAYVLVARRAFQDDIRKKRDWRILVKVWDAYFESCIPSANIKNVEGDRMVFNKGPVNVKVVSKRDVVEVTPIERKPYRFHMLGLVHLPCSKTYMSCAFTQKNHKLARMLLSLGHEVIYYGCEGSDVPCTQFIETHTLKDVCEAWGDGDNRYEIGYDWTNTDFRHDFNMQRKPVTLKFNKNCIDIINKIKRPDDFLLLTQGYYQKPIAEGVKVFLTCEPGIGYRGSITGGFRAFESSYIMNFTYGSAAPYECINGSYYDRVIPNYFDPDDVEFSNVKDDYYFFIGRMIKRKGILTAYLACEALGKKLVIAGQGGIVLPDGSLTATTLPDFKIPKGHWEYVGFVDGQARKDLYKHAIATFTPTEYLECLLPGEIVLGSNKRIEDFNIDDVVIQSDASIGGVKATISNNYNGDYYEIKPRFTFPLNITPEHPLLIAILKHKYDPALKKSHKKPVVFFKESTRWVKAKDVKVGDYLVMPKYNVVKDIDSLDLTSYIRGRTHDEFRDKFADVRVDQDLLWLLGVYLAEGHIVRGKNHGKYIDNKGIGFTLHKKEVGFANKIKKIVKDKFGGSVVVNVRKDNSMQLRVISYALSKFTEDTFGSGASNKSIAWWILNLPKEKLLSFMQGYIDGDGYYHNKEQLCIKTVSKILALQIQLLCTKFNILLGVVSIKAGECLIDGRSVKRKDIYSLRSRIKSILNPDNARGNTKKFYKEDSENFYIPICNIVKRSYIGKVYNLHTENNTFLVSNIVTHNCFAGTHIESMLHGTPVITTDFGVFPGTVINGVNGKRCSTLQDFVDAAIELKSYKPEVVRASAEKYLMDNVKMEYQKWFDDLYCVYESASDPTKKGWHRLR